MLGLLAAIFQSQTAVGESDVDQNSLILWIARVWGTLILAFVLVFMVSGIFGTDAGEGLRDAREVMTFILFPGCTVA